MPTTKKPIHLEKQRRLVFLRIFGNLSLLVGTVLIAVTAVVPGLQIAGIPMLMMAGAGILGTYIGTNFLYGITINLIRLTWQFLKEQRELYDFWFRQQNPKPSWFQEKLARLRYLYIPAVFRAISELSAQTQFALNESSLVSANIAQLSKTSQKLDRIAKMLSSINSNITLPSIESDSFSDAKADYYERLQSLGYDSFEEAVEAEKARIRDSNALSGNYAEIDTASIRQQLRQRLYDPDFKKSALVKINIDGLLEKEGNGRIFVFLRVLGNLALIVVLFGVITPVTAFPILSTTVLINAFMIGTALITSYVGINFGWDTIKSVYNISRRYIHEKEQIFTLWREENNIKQSVFSLSYLNARVQLIYFPAITEGIVDLLSNLKTAFLESTAEFLDIPRVNKALRLTHLLSGVKEGWTKTFGIPKKLAEFQETEKIFSGLLENMGYRSFEEGVLNIMSQPSIRSRAVAHERLMDKLRSGFSDFHAKYPTPDEQNRQLTNMHRRFQGYLRAVKNKEIEILINKKNSTKKDIENARHDARILIRQRHLSGDSFDTELEQIDLETEPSSPLDERAWVPLRVLGNLSLAAGVLLGILSFALPGLPAIVIPVLMGTGAAMVLTYIGVNFRFDSLTTVKKTSKKYVQERIPYFDIWLEKEKNSGRHISGIKYLFTRLLCTAIPAIGEAISIINSKLDNEISNITREGMNISDAYISKRATEIYKERKALNWLEKIIKDLSIDLIPRDFSETSELIDAFLYQKGYKNFEDAIVKRIEDMQKDEPHPTENLGLFREEVQAALSKELLEEMREFDKKLYALMEEEHISKFEARQKLITPYYKQYKAMQKDVSLDNNIDLKKSAALEIHDNLVHGQDDPINDQESPKLKNRN